MKASTLCLLFAIWASPALAQYASSSKTPKKAGDLIESTSYNDHKRGAPRHLQYLPDGEDFLSVNGKNRYTRALYGSPTAWRLETSDRPIFATYVKNDSRNIRFRLRLPDGRLTPLEETSWCEARYKPGSRIYLLKDKAWGEDSSLKITVLASPTDESAIWQFSGQLPPGCVIEALNAPIRRKKLSRSGDMGADPPGSFDPAEDGTVLQTFECPFLSGESTYIGITENRLHGVDNPALFPEWENARRALAGRIKITTPDPYFNTLGGALAVAADGVWGTEGVWLHGAVGWRMPLSGWRAGYTGDALGWHDRARTHFDNYAASQVTDVPNTRPHPAQDSALALARSVKEWGTPQYSNGYICRNPQRNNQMHHYDMNLCYIDELLWHFNWTGDLEYARRMWPVLTLHLAWEKRNFDPDNDGLYDAYACIWASDALYYNSGAVTHSSAYNYRANRMAALIASKIGEDPTPYQAEADKILKALNSRLWLEDKGHWAEFQDFMGHKRLHENAGVWTIYHALDSDVADPFQAYLATRYVDREIPHIPVMSSAEAFSAGSQVPAVNAAAYAAWQQCLLQAGAAINADEYATVSTTNWLPYSWSINNVAFAEVMHTALSYFQAGRAEAGFKLLKSSVLDGMYLGESPGNFGQISFYDAARGECYRDFGDPIGVASRVLIQGLYGILPDALNGRLLIKPGFPSEWEYASLHTPDVDFDFRNEEFSSFIIAHRLPAVNTLELQFPARRSQVAHVKVNGQAASWKLVDDAVGHPVLSVSVPAASGQQMEISIAWAGELITTPADLRSIPASRIKDGGPVQFVAMEQGQMKWWVPLEKSAASAGVALSAGVAAASTESTSVSSAKATASSGVASTDSASPFFANVVSDKCTPVEMDRAFNANVTDIFRNEYLSPRSPYTTLQIPVQGIGEWCHPLKTADIDDSGLRASVRTDSRTSKGSGILETKLGIPFRTPAEGHNIAFTSLWDNYPDSLKVPLKGKASRAYLLMAGSTNHMQCHIDNGVIRIYYKDGTCDTLPLVNPDNWPPIEQIFFEDGKAFNRHAPSLYRLRLKTGEVSNNFGEELAFPGVSREVDGGAAVLLEMPLNPKKSLSHLVLETLSNEVVIGLMGVTLQR